MRHTMIVFLIALTCNLSLFAQNPIAIALHGGAGTILKENLSTEKEAAIRAKLKEALDAGYAVLEKGGSSVDAVEAAIIILEDSPLFNAGKGAVFTHDQSHELDASIMEGAGLNAGATAAVTHIKNPIRLARAVMEHSPHVMLVGEGAEVFAKTRNLTFVENSYFSTPFRLKQLEEKQGKKHGTVGVVALDRQGNLAAGTSTGGTTDKRFGRVGDSPIIGAGTYADNQGCAVSATGHGEYFIRAAVAFDINARVRYLNLGVQEAADQVIQKKLVDMGGDGGVIVLDRQGNIAFSFNTAGMYRAMRRENAEAEVMIYR